MPWLTRFYRAWVFDIINDNETVGFHGIAGANGVRPFLG